MNPSSFDYSEAGSDTERLLAFLDDTETLLDELVSGDLEVPLPEDLGKLAVLAWKDVRSHFGPLRKAVKDLSTQECRSHGLAGDQLRFKLGVIKKFFDKRFWRPLLKAIDILLKSILDAAGLGSAVDEFKSALELAFEDE